ncbi:SEC14 cytosolic factor-like [Hibiscus syriacus]|uniref:SEC14 cytosolic factor-like n=1 Tax=Hibiscus syriacus TaxID=106335 RepID=UPI001923C23D|nr:SEC14 cytosolic factor-like [Hibiscus syriacus]
MSNVHEEAIKKFVSLMENVDEKMKGTFQNMHHGHLAENLERFLKARDWDVQKAYKMLTDCLQWRIQNEIDTILSKPIIPADLYRAVRDSQLVGLSGYSKEGLPVIALGVGLSTYDKASPAAQRKYGRHIGTCLKVLDMTGLKLSALNQIKLLTTISTIDDLNYPEKTETYYIVNAPYIFSACWKAVKPLLQERTKRKIQVLQGCGRDELLKVRKHSSVHAHKTLLKSCFRFLNSSNTLLFFWMHIPPLIGGCMN